MATVDHNESVAGTPLLPHGVLSHSGDPTPRSVGVRQGASGQGVARILQAAMLAPAPMPSMSEIVPVQVLPQTTMRF